jgi:hypothetical protein
MDEAAPGRPRRQASPERELGPAGLEALEAEVARLSAAVAGLEKRLTSLESESAVGPRAEVVTGDSLGEEHLEAPDLAELVPDPRAVSGALTEIGRCILIAAGGFLVRAITDAGILPRPAGVAAGLAYALAWLLFADRAAARGRSRTASFQSITAMGLGYPLLIETTVRMHAFSATGVSAAAAALTALVLVVASRRKLLAAGWMAVLAQAAAAVVLGAATGRPGPFAAASVAIAWITALLADTWEGAGSLRWPAALVADALVLWTLLAPQGRQPAAGAPSLSAFALAAVLAVGQLIWVSWRARARRRSPGGFEAFQTTASLAIGFLAAVQAVAIAPSSSIWLGGAFFATAAACLAFARWAARRALPRRIALLYATWAAALLLCGGWMLPDAGARALLWALAGIGACVIGRRRGWHLLRLHATLLLLAAALQSGLLSSSAGAVAFEQAGSGRPFHASAAAVLVAVALSYLLIRWRAEEKDQAVALAAALVLGAIGSFALAALTIAALRAIWPADAATLAALRTAALSGAALLLAWARRRWQRQELSWLAAAFLVAGAVKLVFEDLPNGRSLTLFAGLVLYGGALLGVQRLLRSRAPRAA